MTLEIATISPLPDEAPVALAVALQHAFPPIHQAALNLPEPESLVDAELRSVIAPPVILSVEELAREFDRQRVVIAQGPAAIPLHWLFSIGGAVLLHLILAGLFILACLYVVGVSNKTHGTWSAEAEGGSGAGYMVMGTGQQGEPALSGDIADLLAKAHEASADQSIPALTTPRDAPPKTPLEELASAPQPEIIGMPRSTADLGTIRTRPSAVPRTPAVDVNNIAAPPVASRATHNDVDPTAIASAAGKTGTRAGSPTPGPGSGGSDDDEPIYDKVMKAGTGGAGNGHGKGSGEGNERGNSGANNESPQVLESPPLQLPLGWELHPPKHSAKFDVVVLANGKAGEIKLVQSCGDPDIDALIKANIARYRFRPAYLAGQAIVRTMSISQSFGVGD